ncbi:MAG: hypothetical protein ACYC36_13290 [Bellilinea sp.]
MKHEDVKIGMKVVPHSKTVGGWSDLGKSSSWERAKKCHQPYLFVNKFSTDRNSIGIGNINAWVLSVEEGIGGDFFNASDFEPYQETQPATSYVVAGDLPTRITYWHDTYASAETEAKRLCLKEGKNFHVLKVIAVIEPAQPTIIRIGE